MNDQQIETMPAPIPVEAAKPKGNRFLEELLWLVMGLVLPAGSFTFYKKAAKRSAGFAFLFFFLFSTALAVIATTGVNRQMDTAVKDLEKELTKMVFPAITVRDGVATAKGPQPYVIYGSEGEIFAIDTTGKLNSIDTSNYHTGVLLSRTGVQVVQASNGRNQTISWVDLQDMVKTNPLVIDKAAILGWTATLMGYVKGAALVGIWFWEVLGRLMIMLVIGLIFWGLGALIKPGTGFGAVMVVGIYAYVPAVYFNFVLGQAKLNFPLKLSLVHFLIWGVMLLFTLDAFGKGTLSKERGLRTWRVLIGVPILVLMPLQYVQGWDAPVNYAVIAWGLMEIALLAFGIQGVLAQPLEPVEPPPTPL